MQDTRHPITFNILKLLVSSCDQVCRSPLEVQLFKTAFSLAFMVLFVLANWLRQRSDHHCCCVMLPFQTAGWFVTSAGQEQINAGGVLQFELAV